MPCGTTRARSTRRSSRRSTRADEPATAEYERFLFYRGLGETRLPLRFDEGGKGTLTLDREPIARRRRPARLRPPGRERPRGLQLPPRLAARRTGRRRDPVDGQGPAPGRIHQGHRRRPGRAADRGGLYAKEARAMVNTWTTSYFQTEGIRVLVRAAAVLDRRVHSDDDRPEAQAGRPRDGGPARASDRRAGAPGRERGARPGRPRIRPSDSKPSAFLSEQGRYVEPIVRRVLQNHPGRRGADALPAAAPDRAS